MSNSNRTCGSILFSRVLASEKLSIFVEEDVCLFLFLKLKSNLIPRPQGNWWALGLLTVGVTEPDTTGPRGLPALVKALQEAGWITHK